MNSGLEILACSDNSLYRQVFRENDSLLETPGNCFEEYNLFYKKHMINGLRNCIPMSRKVLKFGRQNSDFIIQHPAISAVHFIVWKVTFDSSIEPLYYLKDTSLNGTYINGVLVGKNNVQILKNNDIISIEFAIKFKFIQLSPRSSNTCFEARLLNNVSKADWRISTEIIGHGSFGSIYVASRRNSSRKTYAAKIIRKVQSNQMARIKQEADILLSLDHPNIIKVHEAIGLGNHVYIFEDLVCGGDLFSYLTDGSCLKPIPESEAIIICFQLLKALDYLHNELNIVHRDLKLENVLLVSPTPASKIVLCDFGLAKVLSGANRTNTVVGTVEYAAPEIFYQFNNSSKGDLRGYTTKCDIWSLGILVHLMLTAVSPFYASGDWKIIHAAAKGTLDFNSPEWKTVGNLAKNFLTKVINPIPDHRLDVTQCLRHPWITRNKAELEVIYNKIISQ